MTRFFLSIFFLLFLSISTHAQQYLVKKNGDLLGFEEIYSEEGYVYLRMVQQVEFVKMLPDDVIGYFDSYRGVFFYYIGEDFFELITEGEITAFRIITTERLSRTLEQINVTLLYLKKGTLFEEVIGTGREKKLAALNELFKDDPEALEKINKLLFDGSFDAVIKLVKNYNLKHYKTKTNLTEETGKVTFYRKSKGQSDDPLALMINNKEISIDSSERTSIQIPLYEPFKVCVDQTCEIIGGFPGFERFFQVSLTKKGKAEIRKMTK